MCQAPCQAPTCLDSRHLHQTSYACLEEAILDQQSLVTPDPPPLKSLDPPLRFQPLHPATCVQFPLIALWPKETGEKLGPVIWGSITKEELQPWRLWGSHHMCWEKTFQCSCFVVTHAPVGYLSAMVCKDTQQLLASPRVNR